MPNQPLKMLTDLYKESLNLYITQFHSEGIINLTNFKLPKEKIEFVKRKDKVTRNELIKYLFAIKLIKTRHDKTVSNNAYLLYIEIYQKLDFYINFAVEFLFNYDNMKERDMLDFMKIYYCFQGIDKRINKILIPFKDDIKRIKKLVKRFPEDKLIQLGVQLP